MVIGSRNNGRWFTHTSVQSDKMEKKRKEKKEREDCGSKWGILYVTRIIVARDTGWNRRSEEHLENVPALVDASTNSTLSRFGHDETFTDPHTSRQLLESIVAMDSLCRRLDQLTLTYLDEFGHLLACKQFIDDTMKQGYFNLSRARVIMGVNNLSSLQYPDHASMTACTKVSVQSSPALEIEKQHDKEHANDPLNWFGLLHPRVLKQSQKSFQQTIDLALEACERQEKLRRLRAEIDSLMKEKQCFLTKENLDANKLLA